jgi:hypothetical protein
MATFIRLSSAESELLRRNRDQVQSNRLQKVEADEQAATGQQLQATVAEQQTLEQPGGRRQLRFRRDQPAASRLLIVKADYYVISYGFTTGKDLDTRTILVDPLTQQPLGPVGWCKDETIAVNDVPIVRWGGDNTDTGFESVLFDRLAYEQQFPGAALPALSLNAFWYDIKGDSVTLSITGYLGGKMVLDEDQYLWTNPTATRVWDEFATFTSDAVQINISDCVDGDFIINLQIDYARGAIAWIP